MLKCDLIKLLCNFIQITLRHGCSPVNLLHFFGTLFPRNTSGWLLLTLIITARDVGWILNQMIRDCSC